ncbi:hypothetical protein EVAR_77935_1 [Eumeta japonica]|uniref:Uncharacterized protein n=1 Tax=Eumeta variegata TaxID=151549 RepID=A0A4C1XS49_EUMVA|nr:hypothetical protein EVAR_77935_1 [Eumeta japonica]
MTDRFKPVTAAHDRRTLRTSELPEMVLRNLENPNKSKRILNPGKPLPPRSKIKKIPSKAKKSIEDVAAGGEYDIPLDETLEPAPSLSPIPEPKKHTTDVKPTHIISNIPQSPSLVRRSGASTAAAWKKD